MRTSLSATTIKLVDTPSARGIYQRLKSCTREISVNDELELLREYKAGNDEKLKEDIRNKLVVNHQRFIFSTAKKYAKDASIIEDLMSEGSIGLMEAVDKFDETKGFTFLSYASWYINKNMSLYLKNVKNIVRDNSYVTTKYSKLIKDITEEYIDENKIAPSPNDIQLIAKEKYGVDIKRSSDIIKSSYIYMDSPLSQNDDDKTFYESDEFNERTADYNYIEKIIDADDIRSKIFSALSTLKERDLEIVKMIFGLAEYEGLDITEDMIATKYDMTKERVRQIKRDAMRLLKRKLSNINK